METLRSQAHIGYSLHRFAGHSSTTEQTGCLFLMELPAIRTETKITECKPTLVPRLPLAPHEPYDAAATVERWLRNADLTAVTTGLSKGQAVEVERQQARLRELWR